MSAGLVEDCHPEEVPVRGMAESDTHRNAFPPDVWPSERVGRHRLAFAERNLTLKKAVRESERP